MLKGILGSLLLLLVELLSTLLGAGSSFSLHSITRHATCIASRLLNTLVYVALKKGRRERERERKKSPAIMLRLTTLSYLPYVYTSREIRLLCIYSVVLSSDNVYKNALQPLYGNTQSIVARCP